MKLAVMMMMMVVMRMFPAGGSLLCVSGDTLQFDRNAVKVSPHCPLQVSGVVMIGVGFAPMEDNTLVAEVTVSAH